MSHLVPLIQLFPQSQRSPNHRRGAEGPDEVTLMLPPDGLYAEQEMEIEFRVLDVENPGPDGSAQPLRRARIRAEADMPSMPAMPKFDEIAHSEAIPGVFGVHPVFPHGGDYRLCLTILSQAPEGWRSACPDAGHVRAFLLVQDAAPTRRLRQQVRRIPSM